MASDEIPFGIYAVEKRNYVELRRDKCDSMGKLKELARNFKANGFKVYMNKGKGHG